jgi:hypothetical protein
MKLMRDNGRKRTNLLEEKIINLQFSMFINLTSNDGHPAAFFNCEDATFVNFTSAFFQGEG